MRFHTRTLLLTAVALPLMAAAPAPPPPPDLSGRWAMLAVETEVAAVPMVGDVTTEAKSLKVVAITQKGTELAIRTQLCGLRFESTSDKVATTVAPAFARHSPAQTRRATLAWDPGASRWTLTAPKAHHVYGARLKNPATDALPTSSEDPRVTDGDKDGEPGVTIAIDGLVSGKIHLVQRLWNVWKDGVVGEGRVEGLIDWGRDQSYLGATNMFLRQPLRTRRHKDPSKDRFVLRKAPDDLTCVKLLAAPGRLLGP